MPELPAPPVAKRIPLPRAYPGGSVVNDGALDEYQWLRDPADPDLIPLLEAENAYADAVLAPQRPLTEQIYAEIRARLNLNALAKDHDYLNLGTLKASPDGRLLAYSVDYQGEPDPAPHRDGRRPQRPLRPLQGMAPRGRNNGLHPPHLSLTPA
ncbi:hypothetical protein LO762_28140 [Actinocorallia sp. API 0066]|uniref:hypothetical protein n=1 Tax=Actinocorallia sp. API 0066 TaxID=2896846 RepID=UPI001E49D689|nr:hypothetical protein [Actinocorallia sp. API 0066]MCD0453023.1 hypothetical protein [Actinocorallia sp. API 0066]